MDGRLERKLKLQSRAEKLLADLPASATDWFYTLSASMEISTCIEYLYKFHHYCEWMKPGNPGNARPEKAKVTDIARYMTAVQTKDKNGVASETTVSYIRLNHSALMSYYGFLKTRGIRRDNPVNDVPLPRRSDNVKRTFLTEDEVNAIISNAESGKGYVWADMDVAMLYVLAHTGMRVSALCSLDMSRIDMLHGTIEVVDKEHATNRYTMTPQMRKALAAWIADREDMLGDIREDAVFLTKKRLERVYPKYVSRVISVYAEDAIGKSIHPHQLRAAYGNILYNKTKDIRFVSKAMKHASIETTEIYLDDDEQSVNDRVAELLGGCEIQSAKPKTVCIGHLEVTIPDEECDGIVGNDFEDDIEAELDRIIDEELREEQEQ